MKIHFAITSSVLNFYDFRGSVSNRDVIPSKFFHRLKSAFSTSVRVRGLFFWFREARFNYFFCALVAFGFFYATATLEGEMESFSQLYKWRRIVWKKCGVADVCADLHPVHDANCNLATLKMGKFLHPSSLMHAHDEGIFFGRIYIVEKILKYTHVNFSLSTLHFPHTLDRSVLF